MSKWRPSSEKNTYVIGDIHGNYQCLKKLLDRILPLRPKDELIFLGDYIDRGKKNYEVVEILSELDNQPNITCLSGNHEWLLMASVGIMNILWMPGDPRPEPVWLSNGGIDTIVSYAIKKGLTIKEAMAIPLTRYKGIIPKKHVEFLQALYQFYETEKYIFVHAGCDPNLPLDEQGNDVLLWDRSLWNYMENNKKKEVSWEKKIVCGHNYKGIFVHPKYLMIDMSGQDKVACVELESMTVCVASPGKERVVINEL